MYEILISDAEQLSKSVLQHYGVPPDHAEIITEVIMDSELRGYDDHGLLFMQIIVQWGFIAHYQLLTAANYYIKNIEFANFN